jgi:hypothetical protein
MVRLPSRRRWLATLVVPAVATALTAVAAPAGAVVAGPSVTIVSPSPDSTQSGMVDFTVSIDQEDTAHRVTEVYLEMYGSQGQQKKSVLIAADQCAPTCTISQSFDTRTLVVPQNALSVDENLADGPVEIAATVYTYFGPNTFVQGRFTLNNGRPTISLPDLPRDPNTNEFPQWSGDDRLRTTVAVTPSALTNEPIDSLRIIVPHSPVIPLADETLPAPSGGTGLLDVDLTKVPPGPYTGYLAAIDDSGLSSALLPIAFWVGHYTISAAVYGVFHSDYGDIIVTPTWTDGTANTWIDNIDAYLDGVLVGHTNGFMHPHVESGVRLQNQGAPFTVGTHTVRLSVTDNRGIVDQLSLPVHVVDPVSLSWTVQPAVTGEPAAVTVTALSATSPIRSVTLADDRGRFATAAAATSSNQLTVHGLVTESTIGTHTLTATVVQTDGYSYQVQHSLQVTQASVSAAYIAGSRTGSAVYINGLVKQTIGSSWTRSANRTVYLQRYLSGHWQSVLVRTTDAHGQLAVGFIQPRTLPYRLYVAASSTAHAATSTRITY